MYVWNFTYRAYCDLHVPTYLMPTPTHQTEGSDEDTVDSDFDVDESQWGEPTETEVEETKRKKKEWIKAYKAKVCYDCSV